MRKILDACAFVFTAAAVALWLYTIMFFGGVM